MPFNPNKPFTVVSEPAQAGEDGSLQGALRVSKIPLTGGFGTELPPEIAADIAARRQIARETAGTGVFPEPESQLPAAISRGLFAGASGEFLPAIAERLGLANRFGTEDPEFTDPLAYEISKVVGGAIPIGKGVYAAKSGTETVRRLIPQIVEALKRSAPISVPFGAAAGAAKPIKEEKGAGSIAFGTGIGATLGLALAAAPPVAISAAQKGGNALINYFSKDPEAFKLVAEKLLYSTLGEIKDKITSQKVGGFIDSGDLQIAVGSIKKTGGLPSALRETVPAVKKTEESLYKEAESFARAHSKYKIKKESVFDPLQEELTQTRRIEEALDPAGVQSLRNVVDRLSKDMTLPESLAAQKELNLLSKKVLNKKQLDITTAEADPDYALLQSMRRRLSGAINDAFTGISGNENNPYRRWGSVHQLGEFLEERFNKIRSIGKQGLRERIGERGLIRGVLPQKTEMATADDAITDLFDITPEFKALQLTRQEAAARLQRSVKTPKQVEAEAIAAQRARTASGLESCVRLKR